MLKVSEFLSMNTKLLGPVAMSDQSPSSSRSGDTDTGTVPTTTNRWAPHGSALTACVVAANVALVFLVYLYFWRVFSRKRVASSSGASARGGEDDSDASSSASAPPSPPRTQGRGEHDRVVASLPTFIHSGGGAAGEKAAECAVCIAELRDGDKACALPRCGHRFHAACVDVWLRLHTTCPLCRASVAVPAPEAEERKGGVSNTTAAVEDTDAPV